MAKQVADGGFAADPWIVQFEVGKVLLHLVVPLNFALLYQHGHHGGGKGFGVGSNGIEGIAIRYSFFAGFKQAIPFGEDQLPVFDNPDADPGSAPGRGSFGKVLVQFGKVGLLAEGEQHQRKDTKYGGINSSHDNNEWGWNIQQNYS